MPRCAQWSSTPARAPSCYIAIYTPRRCHFRRLCCPRQGCRPACWATPRLAKVVVAAVVPRAGKQVAGSKKQVVDKQQRDRKKVQKLAETNQHEQASRSRPVARQGTTTTSTSTSTHRPSRGSSDKINRKRATVGSATATGTGDHPTHRPCSSPPSSRPRPTTSATHGGRQAGWRGSRRGCRWSGPLLDEGTQPSLAWPEPDPES